jgi:hypothetical protein
MDSILKLAAKFTEELNQLNGKNYANQGWNATHVRKIGCGFKVKMEEQNNAWAVHKEYL